MSFKHIRKNLDLSEIYETAYTVPSGKEFVMMKKRVRNPTEYSGSVQFKLGEDTVDTINVSANSVVLSNSTKTLVNADTVIGMYSTIGGLKTDVMGLELKAGTWATIGGGGEASSSSSGSSEESSSSSDSGGSQPSQSVTKITITSSGSPADGEWTLNTSTGSYEKGVLRLECVQDALYAWQIWDREMPEYPELYYSTGYTFQTNNVSEVLGTREWHDVKLDDPITLTLTDTSPNSSDGENSSSSSGASDSSSSSGTTPSSSPSEIIVTATGLTPICTDMTLTIVDPNATGTSRIWRNQHYDEQMYEYSKTEVRYDSASGRWEIYDGMTQGGGENDWMPMPSTIYSETTTADPWTSGLNWYYVDSEVEHNATVSITLANGGSGGTPSEASSSSESSSSSGGAVSGINFIGTYSEDFSFTYTGTFTQTNRTIDVTEWNTQSNETMSTPYHVMSGSFHKVGHEIDYENDSEIPVDEYVTLWLVPAMNPSTYYEWLNSDDSGKVEWANDPDAMAPYYSWGIIEAADCGNEVKSTDGCLGYISEQRYTMPTIQTGDHVYSENAGGWDNCTITVVNGDSVPVHSSSSEEEQSSSSEEQVQSSSSASASTLTLFASGCRFDTPSGYTIHEPEDPDYMEPTCSLSLRFTQHPSLTTTVNDIVYPVWVSDSTRTCTVGGLDQYTPSYTNNVTGDTLANGDVVQTTGNVFYLFAAYAHDSIMETDSGMWIMTTNTEHITGAITSDNGLSWELGYQHPIVNDNTQSVPDVTNFYNKSVECVYDYNDFITPIGDAVSMRLTFSLTGE